MVRQPGDAGDLSGATPAANHGWRRASGGQTTGERGKVGCVQNKGGGRTGELGWGGLDGRVHRWVSEGGQGLGTGRVWGLVRAELPAQQF